MTVAVKDCYCCLVPSTGQRLWNTNQGLKDRGGLGQNPFCQPQSLRPEMVISVDPQCPRVLEGNFPELMHGYGEWHTTFPRFLKWLCGSIRQPQTREQGLGNKGHQKTPKPFNCVQVPTGLWVVSHMFPLCLHLACGFPCPCRSWCFQGVCPSFWGLTLLLLPL